MSETKKRQVLASEKKKMKMKTMTTALTLLRALLWLGVAAIAASGAEVRIASVDEFIIFKNNVNKGANYSGTTVFLDSDVDLAGKSFEPIGNYSRYFCGVFDGQGYAISNLAMASSARFVGLFGYSGGLTIRNLVLDSSCTITSSFSNPEYTYIGGVIGHCNAVYGPCDIKNNVNMGNVTFRGTLSDTNYLYLGGIAGHLYASTSNHEISVKNCANYGDITHSGNSEGSRIGGILGEFRGYNSSKRAHIHNCLNLGPISHNTTSNNLRLGGLIGRTYYASIENCVSGGKISFLIVMSKYVGSIVGYASNETSVNYCYFTSDLSDYNKYNGVTSTESNIIDYGSTTFELNGTASVGSYSGNSLIGALNAYADYYSLGDYSHWLLNKNGNAVSFIINRRTSSIGINYQITLLPSLASEGNVSFDGWYEDDELITPFTGYEITSETKLYGRYCGPNFTVTFDANGGDELAMNEMIIDCDRVYGNLPEATRTGYTFLGWFTEEEGGEEVKSEDIVKVTEDQTLHAYWTINQYTITFEVDGGSECENITQNYNTEVVLPEPTKTGYTFDCWFSDPELNNEYTETTIPAENATLYAKWNINQYNLTFVFNNGAENEVRTLDFNEEIVYPENVEKTGYSFSGWDSNITSMPAHNLTITAQWTEIVPMLVEIVFVKKDLKEGEIREIIREYTDSEFAIEKIEDDKTGGTKAIVKFVDSEKAKEFIRTVDAALARGETNLIKRVGAAQEGSGSFSPAYHLMNLLYLLI